MLDRIRRRREQRCSLLEKARRLRVERNQVCGEFETMLNSCPGKGTVDTGCAKMMGSDTFQQYLSFLSSKEHPLREREKRIVSGMENETRMSFWSAVIPMNIGGQVCREKVAIVAGDAPLVISKPFLQRIGSCSGFEARTSDFQQVGRHVGSGGVSDWSLCDRLDSGMCRSDC